MQVGKRVCCQVRCLGAACRCRRFLVCRAQTTAPNEWTWMGGSSTRSVPRFTEHWERLPPQTFLESATRPQAGPTRAGISGCLRKRLRCQRKQRLAERPLEYQTSTNEWAWMGGSSMMIGVSNGDWGQPGVYGRRERPRREHTWRPIGRHRYHRQQRPCWLLGGGGFDANGSGGNLNDLWEFNPSRTEWTWVSGKRHRGHTDGQPGIYGTLGTAAAGNVPGGRGGPRCGPAKTASVAVGALAWMPRQ